MSYINCTDYLYPLDTEGEGGGDSTEGSIFPDAPILPAEIPSGYVNLPTNIKSAIARGETYVLGVELYLPSEDDIFSASGRAVFCFSPSRFIWKGRTYRDVIKSIPEMKKFIGKTFNTFAFEMLNVERGSKSGATFVFKNLIRGYRIGVRIIFPDLPEEYENSRLIWWGRVDTVQDLTSESVRINCSQEIGNFSYELATQKFQSACPLNFGKGECLGNETLEQKSLLYQTAFRVYGQGGCNRTFARCVQLQNDKFYQGQNSVAISGQFYRTTVEKRGWWIFKRKKTIITPVQYSAQNQKETDNTVIPIVVGRAQIELHAFTWADTGTEIYATMAGPKGEIQGFYNVRGRNTNLTITNIVQHLGELGGVGSQQKSIYFPASGYNSKLSYLDIAFTGSPLDDQPEETPTVTSVIKGSIIPVRDTFDHFVEQWSYNPVWVTRWLMTNFPYTLIKKEWFNEIKNQSTADYCFTVVEDDTGAEIPVISASSEPDYRNNFWQRIRAAGRYDALAAYIDHSLGHGMRSDKKLPGSGDILSPNVELPDDLDPYADLGVIQPDIYWGNGLDPLNTPLRTYLQYRYTTNGVIRDTTRLSDLLFSLILPTFKGFLRFNHFGKIEIDCRKPTDRTFIRQVGENEPTQNPNYPLTSTEIPVTSTEKFREGYGWLLIGVGITSTEIARIKGIRYVNGSAQTQVSCTSSMSMGVTCSERFIERESGPSEIIIDFSGTPSPGEQIVLTFTEPNGDVLKWDYFLDTLDDNLSGITRMFATRLSASMAFRETWIAEIFEGFPNRIYIRCQTGYIQLDRTLKYEHTPGEEVLRVVEIYEDAKDEVNSDGVKDNIKSFTLNANRQETYHGVTSTYISAVQDFAQTQIQPRVAWDAAEQERNLNLLELDLRFVDNYRQAAFLTKSAAIQFVDGNLPATLTTGIRALFHEENDIIAVRHQTMEGVSYTPFSIEDLSFAPDSDTTSMNLRLYLSAMFDERVAKEEKFLESTLTTNPNPTVIPSPVVRPGGYSSTRTGDGAGDTENNIKYEPQKYKTLPIQQLYSPEGRDKL